MVDKNSIFGGMITTLGAAKKTNCDALGVPWEPRYMLIGDANGADPVPSPTQTKLINQVYRAQLNQLRVSPTDANVLIAEVVLPPDVGGWHIRELALEDKDGVFSAVANVPPSYKPLLAQGSGRNQVVRMHIITSGTSNIQLKIDPSVVLATRQYVDEAVNGLLPANKPAGTYTKVTVNDRGVFVSGSNPTTLAGYGITDTFTKDQVTAMIAQASALPVGSMIGFPVDKVAPGFLELDGSLKSVAAYPDLATFLGGAFNKGDEGAGNFRLPESRGEFLRGWDHARGVDAGRTVGSWQKGTVQSFDIGPSNGVCGPRSGILPATGENGRVDLGYDATQAALYPSAAVAVGNAGTVSGLADNGEISYGATRPRNLSVMWCIKAWNAPINQGNIDIAALVPLAAQATEINQGTAKVATATQMLDSANDAVMVTPKKLRFGFAVSLAANGYVALPSWLGGLVIQWGYVPGSLDDLTALISFPMAFPNQCLNVSATADGSQSGASTFVGVGLQKVSVSQFRMNGYGSGMATSGYHWWSLGY